MKLKALVGAASVAASVALIAAPANAEGELRGGMTSIKNVASSLANKSSYGSFKWEAGRSASVDSEAPAKSGGNFKWASRSANSDTQVVARTSRKSKEVRHRWGIQADAEQARHRWGIQSDTDQARHRWGIQSDADQVRHRWGIQSDIDQARHRWGIQSDADQARHRWGIH